VAMSLRDSFAIFADLDVPVNHVRVGGGGARSPLWRQIQASTYGHAVESLVAEEGAAYGAAILAGVGVGVWTTVDAACDVAVRGASVTQPKPDQVATMNARYTEYRRVYPALRSIYRP
jgi:xylulokinase